MVKHMIETLLSSLLTMGIMIAIGYLLKKLKITSDKALKEISDVLVYVLLPCSVLSSSAREFNPETGKGIIICMAISFLFYTFSLLFSYGAMKASKIPSEKFGASVTSIVFANTGFLGYPLNQSLFGAEGLLCAVSFGFFYNPFMFTIGIKLFSNENEKFSIKSIISPALISCIVANVFYFMQIKMPAPIQSACSSLGSAMTPISMIVIGAGLAGVNIKSIFSDRFSYVVCFLRLVFMPLVVYFATMPFASSIPTVARQVCVLMSGLPVGSLNVILAKKYGGNAEYANATMLISMILCLVTLPLILCLPY